METVLLIGTWIMLALVGLGLLSTAKWMRAVTDLLIHRDSELGPRNNDPPVAACHDCGLAYSDAGFQDLVVPNEVWAQISPTGDEGGMLCPTCLARRCAMAGIETRAVWRSGPFFEVISTEGAMK